MINAEKKNQYRSYDIAMTLRRYTRTAGIEMVPSSYYPDDQIFVIKKKKKFTNTSRFLVSVYVRFY